MINKDFCLPWSLRLVVLLLLSLLLLSVLAACSSSSEKEDVTYRNAETLAQLQIPDDLEKPRQSNALDVPEQFDKGEIPDNLEVPPPIEGVLIQDDAAKPEGDEENAGDDAEVPVKGDIVRRSDDMDVLALNAEVDTVWPMVAKTVKRLGFEIVDSNRGKHYYSISRDIEKLELVDDPSKPIEVEFRKPKEEYMIYVEAGEMGAEITIRNLQGKIDGSAIARHLLQQIKAGLQSPAKKK